MQLPPSHLAPNGTVQLHESSTHFHSDDNSIPPRSASYIADFAQASKLAGFVDITPHLATYLKNAGFVDIKVVIKKLSLGAWAKEKKAQGSWEVGDGDS